MCGLSANRSYPCRHAEVACHRPDPTFRQVTVSRERRRNNLKFCCTSPLSRGFLLVVSQESFVEKLGLMRRISSTSARAFFSHPDST
jgi:hypothetical protein